MSFVLIGLGSNLGDRADVLDSALAQLSDHANIDVVARSRWQGTPPIGGPPGQGEFLNGAAYLHTTLSPEELLAELLQTEKALGRERTERWSARQLDLDLLLYDDLVVDSPPLQIPHPRMTFRRFVLSPAVEVAPQMVHPLNKWTIDQLWRNLNTKKKFVAIAGGTADFRRDMAKDLCDQVGGKFLSCLTGATGRSKNDALELCRRNAEALNDAVSSDNEAWTVGDFWFDALPDELTQSNVEATQLRHCREFVAVRSTVAKPKILFLFESASEQGEQLRRIAFHPDCGPSLVLDTEDPDTALIEMTAAIEAMME